MRSVGLGYGMAKKTPSQTAEIKRYGNEGSWFIVGSDGDLICKLGFKYSQVAMDWMKKYHPEYTVTLQILNTTTIQGPK